MAHSASVEAFRMRPPPTRLCPAKGGAGLSASVLQCHPRATHSSIPWTSSRCHHGAGYLAQERSQAHAEKDEFIELL